MVMLYDGKKKKQSFAPKKRDPRIFQDKFTTGQIPLKRDRVEVLEKEVKYPYPPQVVASAMIFPIPIPRECIGDMEVAITREEGKNVYLKQARNLLVSFSTASGKTFLAKLFMLKHADKGLAVYTCPLKSLAEEKYKEFSEQLSMLKVGMMTGDFHQLKISQLDECNILIVTYEKLDALLRNNREKMEDLISCVVVDEIHVMGTNRGSVIEDLITKVKALNIPLMGMSATVGNVKEIARWLGADLVKSDFRPVPLKMGVLDLVNTQIEYEDGTFKNFNVNGKDSIEKIIAEHVLKGEQTMYVRQSRRMVESFAKRMVPKLGGTFFDDGMEIPMTRTDDENELNRCVKYGVAFHHAGLSQENRSYIEEKFKEGEIRFISATTTLSAGINIPAKYVFLDWKRWSGFGTEPISASEALQILHRAGRPQYDEEGYGILVCNKDEDYDYCINNYFSARPEPIKSNFIKDPNNFYHSIIGNIGGNYANTREELLKLYKKTFAWSQNPREMKLKIENAITRFKDYSEPMIEERDGRYVLTNVGSIIKRYYVNPSDAMIIVKMIKNSDTLAPLAIVHGILRCESMYPMRIKGGEREWHDIYMKTRDDLYYKHFSVNDEIEWRAFQTACVLIGHGEEGQIIYADENVRIGQLCYFYGITAGDLQRTVGIQGNFSWLLAFASAVARMYGKSEIVETIYDLETRLRYGISEKLVPICRIKNIGKERGKALFTVGYCSVESIAEAEPSDIAEMKVNEKKIGIKLAQGIVDSAKNFLGRNSG